MAVKRLPDGRWRVDVEPVKGKRFRKIFSTKAEALRFEAHKKTLAYNPDWLPEKKDKRRLSELVQLWHELHGLTLRDCSRRIARLNHIVDWMGDPVAVDVTPALFGRYRAARLNSGISERTVNNDLTFIRSMFNHLRTHGVINYENPLLLVQVLKHQEKRFSFLSDSQVVELLEQCKGSGNIHVMLLTVICLSTGCRWSESENLTLDHVLPGAVIFENTKGRRVRSVPVSADLAKAIRLHLKKYGRFTGSLSSFRRALSRCSFTLPRGQASHVLRHTFASRFVQNGGNLLTLQRILGHTSIQVTMRYAHLAPEHLNEALKLNPLAGFDILTTLK